MKHYRLIDPVVAPPIRRTRIEVDLDAACRNAAVIQRVAGVGLIAVVKADAYGHGAVQVATALESSGTVAWLAVSLVEEGVELRNAGIRSPIIVMGPSLAGGHQTLVDHDMIALVGDLSDLEQLTAIGVERNQPVPVHLKIDTGMGRLGLAPEGLAAAIAGPIGTGGVQVTGLATHFACADTDDPSDPSSMTRSQLARFGDAVRALSQCGVDPQVVHAANSAATFRFSDARFDLVRCGLAVYGNGGSGGDNALHQVMRLVAHIAAIREVAPGETVSYGALWTAERPSRIAVLPVGYADGYPRNLTGRAEVLVAGRRCPVAGAISMDITLADVTALGDAASVGDQVTLLGAQGGECIRTAELAERAGVLEYEVTCGMSKRVPRVYG